MCTSQPLYGFGAVEPLQFSRAQGHNDVYYVQDRELDVDEVYSCPSPRHPNSPIAPPGWLPAGFIYCIIQGNDSVERRAARTGDGFPKRT